MRLVQFIGVGICFTALAIETLATKYQEMKEWSSTN